MNSLSWPATVRGGCKPERLAGVWWRWRVAFEGMALHPLWSYLHHPWSYFLLWLTGVSCQAAKFIWKTWLGIGWIQVYDSTCFRQKKCRCSRIKLIFSCFCCPHLTKVQGRIPDIPHPHSCYLPGKVNTAHLISYWCISVKLLNQSSDCGQHFSCVPSSWIIPGLINDNDLETFRTRTSFASCKYFAVFGVKLIVSDSLPPHGLQHATLLCLPLSPRVCSNSIELVMLSNHLILCNPLLLSPSIFPSIRVFSEESALHIRWPKFFTSGGQSTAASASASVLPMNIQSWFPLGLAGLISKYQFLSVQPSLRSTAITFTARCDYWKKHSFDHINTT